MKKLVTLLLLAVICVPCGTMSVVAKEVVKSTNWGDQFITNEELDDANGHKQDEFGIHDNMNAHWDFTIPEGKGKSGDLIEVDIPKQLAINSNVSFGIKDSLGNIIGYATVDSASKKVTIKLTDAVSSNHEDIMGSFNIWVHWDETQVENNTTITIHWSTGDQTIDINGNGEKPDPNEIISKWGWIDSSDESIIHWRVRINFAKREIKNTVYTDVIGDNQTLIENSIAAYLVEFIDDTGSDFNITKWIDTNNIIEDNNSRFHVNIGDINSAAVIDYSTKVIDLNKGKQYENSGELVGDNIETQIVDVWTEENGGNGQAITKTEIDGQKFWKDDNNKLKLRPNSIFVDLYQDNRKIRTIEVTKESNWKYKIKGLNKYNQNGKEYKYIVKEEKVSNYKTIQNGYNFTNILKKGKKNLLLPNTGDK